jgi:hypothetical protein
MLYSANDCAIIEHEANGLMRTGWGNKLLGGNLHQCHFVQHK